MITLAHVNERFDYDAATGRLFWKGGPRDGMEAGGVSHYGYRRVEVGGKQQLVHRLIWLIEHGALPSDQIDHIDGNRLNNQINNLRVVSQSEQRRNQRRPRNNRSGHVGIGLNAGKWRVFVGRTYIGRFDTFDEAVSARTAAERAHDYHENHGRAA